MRSRCEAWGCSMVLRFMSQAGLAILVGIALLAGSTGVARADGPGGTGVTYDPTAPRTPEGLGYTPEYAAEKAAAASRRITPAGVLAARSAAASSPGMTATSVISSTLYVPTSANLLAWWTSYHEKTNYNCLPAVGQSMLGSNFPNAGYTSPSVAAKQGTASQASGTITKGMKTTTNGTDDGNALAYVNGQFAAQGSAWRFIPTNIVDEATFKWRIEDEIFNQDNAMYVRVDLTNSNYAWHQATPAQHATAAVAYSSSAAYTTIDDPFTHLSAGVCVATPYTSSNDTSCNWSNFSTHRYYLSKDVVRNGNNPIWY